MSIKDIPKNELEGMIRAVQTALDGLWFDEQELMADTGMSDDDAKEILPLIRKFQAIELPARVTG